MRKLYAVLAWTIAGAVVVQAAAIAFAFGGMLNLVAEGGVVDKALLESVQAAGVGEVGFMIHGLVGGVLIPLIALALLVVSFFVRARGAKLWAAITFGLVVLQVIARLLDHRRAVPRADPRSQRARRRGHGVGRGPACRTPTRGRGGPPRRGGDDRCRLGVTSCGAASSASRSRPRSAPARSRGAPRCSASTR